MDDREIDKYFKDEKENESIAPPAFVWEGLEDELRGKGRKRRYFIWLFFGIVFISGLGYLMLSEKEATNIISMDGHLTTSKKTDSESVNTDILKSKNDASPQDMGLEDELSDYAKSMDTPQNDRASQFENINNPEVQSRTSEITQNSSTSIYSSTLRNEPITQESTFGAQSSDNHAESQFFNTKTGKGSVEIPDQGNDYKQSLLATSKQIEVAIINTLIHPFLAYERNVEAPIFDVRPPIVKVRKKRNSIALFFHLGKPNFQTESTAEPQNSYETDWYSYGLGISYQRELIDKFHLGLGLNFRQSKRKFNYETNDLYLRDFMPNQSENALLEYGIITSQGEQRFTFFDLTLGIGYDVSIGKLRVRPGLDALINLKLMTEGKSWEYGLGIQHYGTSDERYQSSLGLGISPSISFGFPMGSDVMLSFTPRYETYFEELENVRSGRVLKYSNLGAELGMRKQF